MYSPSRINYDLKSDSTIDALQRMATYDAFNAYCHGIITWAQLNLFVAEINAYVAA